MIEPEPDPEAVIEPEPEPEVVAEADREAEPVAEVEVLAEAKPAAETEPPEAQAPAAEPEPAAEAEAAIEPEPEPEPEVTVEPEAIPEPAAEAPAPAPEEAPPAAEAPAEQSAPEEPASSEAPLDEVEASEEGEEIVPAPPISGRTQEKPAARSMFQRLQERLGKTRDALIYRLDRLFLGKKEIDQDLYEQLEEILITADLGVATTLELIDVARKKVKRDQLSDPQALKDIIRDQILAYIEATDQPAELVLPEEGPFVIMVVGVNGVGKTTTIGKIAAKFVRSGQSVLLVAADTFRAAAIDQLRIWGERVGVRVIAQKPNADLPRWCSTAWSTAPHGVDVIIIDTAGRLHTSVNLMAELEEDQRVIGKKMEGAPHEVMLGLDATTGQNGIAQAKMFHEAVGVTGLTLTKLDGTAKGGIVANVCREIRIPVRFIGIGEQLDDLRDFDAREFVEALFAGRGRGHPPPRDGPARPLFLHSPRRPSPNPVALIHGISIPQPAGWRRLPAAGGPAGPGHRRPARPVQTARLLPHHRPGLCPAPGRRLLRLLLLRPAPGLHLRGLADRDAQPVRVPAGQHPGEDRPGDGHFTRAELTAMLNFFQYNLRYNQDQMYWVKQLIKEARDADNDLHQLVDEFRANFAYEPRLILLELIYQIVHLKQPPPENELRLAREIAARFEISSYDQRTIEAKYMYRQRQRRGHRRQPGGTVLRGPRPAAGRATSSRSRRPTAS